MINITSERINYRDRTRSINYPNEADLRYNLWNPRFPPFDPVIALKDLSQPFCPKFIFLKNIKGRQPMPHVIFKIPGQEIDDRNVYRHYYRHKNAFDFGVVEILKYIVWNNEGSRLIDLPLETIQWRNLFTQFTDSDHRDAIHYLSRFFQRLQNEGTLGRYQDSRGDIFFNFQIFNPEIILPPSEDGMPYELALRRTERNPNPYRFRWNGLFPGYSIITEINIDRYEIVSYLFYTRDFIRLVPENENFTNFENQMFIIPSLHHLWLNRLALSSLAPEYLQNFVLNFANTEIFQSVLGEEVPSSQDFSRFNLRLETLDQTYTENYLNELRINLPLRTAQTLLMLKLLHGRRPNLILNTNFECLVPDSRGQFCGLSGNLGCRMRDYVQIPPAVVVENVLSFQKYIRDEITLNSSGFYYLFKFIDNLLELKNHIGIWVGQIERRDNMLFFQNRIFDDDIPREQKLYIAFWSPFLFLVDLEVRLIDEDDGTIITNFLESPIRRQNLNDIFEYFSQNEILPIIIGEFPVEEYIRNFRRQQYAIWRASNFTTTQNDDETIQQYELRVLGERLAQNDKRAGEGIFGNRVRFI